MADQFDFVSKFAGELIEVTTQQELLTKDEIQKRENRKKAYEQMYAIKKAEKLECDRLFAQIEDEVKSAQQMFKTSMEDGKNVVVSSITDILKSGVSDNAPTLVNKHFGVSSFNKTN